MSIGYLFWWFVFSLLYICIPRCQNDNIIVHVTECRCLIVIYLCLTFYLYLVFYGMMPMFFFYFFHVYQLSTYDVDLEYISSLECDFTMVINSRKDVDERPDIYLSLIFWWSIRAAFTSYFTNTVKKGKQTISLCLVHVIFIYFV